MREHVLTFTFDHPEMLYLHHLYHPPNRGSQYTNLQAHSCNPTWADMYENFFPQWRLCL